MQYSPNAATRKQLRSRIFHGMLLNRNASLSRCLAFSFFFPLFSSRLYASPVVSILKFPSPLICIFIRFRFGPSPSSVLRDLIFNTRLERGTRSQVEPQTEESVMVVACNTQPEHGALLTYRPSTPLSNLQPGFHGKETSVIQQAVGSRAAVVSLPWFSGFYLSLFLPLSHSSPVDFVFFFHAHSPTSVLHNSRAEPFDGVPSMWSSTSSLAHFPAVSCNVGLPPNVASSTTKWNETPRPDRDITHSLTFRAT
ncbi:hypothetical protein DFH06DRAFT_1259092 [Mycena polygramma]|nr:hypothetical protein DFH06DRAFT_1259092 [Mycena polygramma]